MLPSFANQSVTRLRASKQEVRGKQVDDWDDPVSLEIEGCSIQPASTSMTLDLRIASEASMTAYVPADADIAANDRVEYMGDIYTVLGTSRAWPSPAGGLSHKVVALKEWRG